MQAQARDHGLRPVVASPRWPHVVGAPGGPKNLAGDTGPTGHPKGSPVAQLLVQLRGLDQRLGDAPSTSSRVLGPVAWRTKGLRDCSESLRS
jgi:hypothetical protein